MVAGGERSEDLGERFAPIDDLGCRSGEHEQALGAEQLPDPAEERHRVGDVLAARTAAVAPNDRFLLERMQAQTLKLYGALNAA